MTFQSPALFWDRVFETTDRAYVKARSADESFGMLCMVGPFEEELREARSVLDIGPGDALLLRSPYCAGKQRAAVDISAVNRGRLASHGIDAYAPHDVKPPEHCVDLAWSTSCFPHCDYGMQRLLFATVAHALRPGGLFYLEGVEQRQGYPDIAEDERGPAGRYWQTPFDAARVAETFGLVARGLVERSLGRDCPVSGWFLRLVRE